MPVLRSHIDTSSEWFAKNCKDMREQLAELDELHQQAAAGGGPRAMARMRSRDKMPVRERISMLVDRDSPFYEISSLAGYCSNYAVGGGLVMGIGVVNGVECMIEGNDPTVLGGAITVFAGRKIMRAIEISRDNRMPYIQFVESAGGDLRGNDDPERQMREQENHFAESGRLFYDVTELSKLKIPSISVVFGSSTAGGAYQPGMSDYNIFIRNQSKVFLGGPPLVKMATGEDSDDETLGGAQMHAEISGLADYLAEDEADGLRICREVVAHLNWRKQGPGPTMPADPPVHVPEEMLGLMPRDLQALIDCREVIARITDGSRFEEFKARYGTTAHVRLGFDPWLPGRHPRQQRTAVQRQLREGHPVHPALQPAGHPAAVPAEHHRLHGGQGLRAGRHRQERLEDDQRRVQLDGAPHHRDLGQQLRGGELRHVGAGRSTPVSPTCGRPPRSPSWDRSRSLV